MADIGGIIRELLIKIGVLGGPEARAEMDAQAASVEKVGAAGTAAAAATTASSTEQANALKNVADSLSRASANSASYAEVAGTTGKGVEVVYQALAGSVSNLETSIKKAGGAQMVPPETITALNGFKAQLLAAQPPVEEHAKGMGRIRDAHIGAKVGMDVSREAMGPVARAFYALTESGNAVIATIGKMGLIIGSAVGGFIFLGKALTELSARGVDVTTMGDRMSGIWDSIARALGGTSAATAAATASMAAAEGKMQELDATQRSYGTGLDLLVGLSLDAGKSMKVFEGDLSDTNVTITGFEAQAHDGVAAINALNQAFNTIATLSPQRAAAYRAEFATLTTAAQSGSRESLTALQTFELGVTKAASEIDAKLTAIALAEGKSAAGAKEWAKDAGQIGATATNAAAGLDTLRKSGETEYESFNKLKGPIEAVLAFYTRYPSALSALDAPQKALVQGLIAEAQSHSGVIVEEEKHAAKISDLRGKYADILGAIEAADKKYGDRKVAITSLLPVIDGEIASLEKERAANRGLDPEQQRILDGYIKLRLELGLTAEAHSKYAKTVDDGLKKQHDLSKSYEDLTRAREKDKESIEKHRVDFIAGMDAELKKAVESGNAQVKALDEQHKAQEIDDHEYAQSVNQIFADMAAAKKAAIEAEDKANEEAIRKEKEHQKTYEETAGAMLKAYEEATGTVIKSLADLKIKQAEFDTDSAATLARVRGEWDKTTDKVKDHFAAYEPLKIVWGSFEQTVLTGSGNINVAIDGMTVKVDNLITKLGELDKVSSAAFGGMGGGAPEQFGPPTPAPEPTGSAPGSEFEI